MQEGWRHTLIKVRRVERKYQQKIRGKMAVEISKKRRRRRRADETKSILLPYMRIILQTSFVRAQNQPHISGAQVYISGR